MDINLITNFCIYGIILIGIYFVWSAFRIKLCCSNAIAKATQSDNALESLESQFKALVDEYVKTLSINVNGNKKTNIPANEFFSEFTVCKVRGINLRLIDSNAATLVGLGLLGTFLGLTLGIKGFDSSNSDNIQKSIQSLLNGMGTAFLTSLFGMGLSICYTLFEKCWRNGLAKQLHDLTQKLDNEYYIDDVELATYRQKLMNDQLSDSFATELHKLYDKIRPLMHYQNAEGNEVPIANAVREILTNEEEQTKSLKQFSSDLALELNAGFDEALSRQMQQRLIPLMESVDATTKAVVEQIDQFAISISTPAANMIERVISDLKDSLIGVMNDFKSALSKHATTELENLAMSLGTATQAIAEFPQNMSHISEVLQLTITEVRSSIAEISNSSAVANSSAMKQMQEQIVFATSSVSDAIAEIKEVMSAITESMQLSMRSMSDDLADKQTTMLTLQSDAAAEMKNIVEGMSASWQQLSEEMIARTEDLLAKFDASIEYMSTTNSEVSGTMELFQQAQTSITGTTSHLQSISSDMKNATEQFHKGQADYSQSLERVQKETDNKLHEIIELFGTAGTVSDEYVQKFEVIKSGLSLIFTQIQNGLNEYQRSVSASLQKYLDSYTGSLTAATDALSSSIQQQNEVVEMLVDSVSRNKK